MKKVHITISLKLKLLLEIALSFILALVYLFASSVYVLGPYFQKNYNNWSESCRFYLALAYLASFVGVFVLCFLLMSNRHIKYIKYIAREVKLIAGGNLGQTLKIKGKDELAELCININTMSKELKNKFEYERELERTKSELITNVSHDLRTPLTPIIAYLDILRNEKFSTKEEEKEYLNSSYNLSIKLKKLIDELFEYTKLSSKEIVLELVDVDICPILNQIVGEYVPMLESKGLRVVTQISDAELPVKVDVEKMVRVFDNIISNAEKYSSKPSDIIVKADNKGDYVVISISNKGEHLEQDKLNRMFEKFYRVDISRSSNIEGSGLGLAISKKIVELHYGQIWAECDSDIVTINVILPSVKY
ncbi:HAMP domain-containing sensor histidine kinase [Clostridium sp.]|uniref:HAMP domain-containing sensor histidine kinase n=1 Tax=Clostridium sp. TaxID=1506 RepID=UPI002847BCDE|nr:HAMP domain-containing sensor histidine kinase [Clostridium sp.]MDR3594299.1 HAMP domain-containing sensor histidine kinase [Clostridium sp.]